MKKDKPNNYEPFGPMIDYIPQGMFFDALGGLCKFDVVSQGPKHLFQLQGMQENGKWSKLESAAVFLPVRKAVRRIDTIKK